MPRTDGHTYTITSAHKNAHGTRVLSDELVLHFLHGLAGGGDLAVGRHLLGDHEALVAPDLRPPLLLQPLQLLPALLHRQCHPTPPISGSLNLKMRLVINLLTKLRSIGPHIPSLSTASSFRPSRQHWMRLSQLLHKEDHEAHDVYTCLVIL
jgi:hypothetical protein